MVRKKRDCLKQKLKKGAGEFLGGAITMVAYTMLFVLLTGLVVFNFNMNMIDKASQRIARDVVVCGNLKKAKDLAQAEAEYILSGDQFTNVEANVYYAPGSGKEWKKGNYINISIAANTKKMMPFENRRKESTTMMMIERMEDDNNED